MKIWEYFINIKNDGTIEQIKGIFQTIQEENNNPFEWLSSDVAKNLDNLLINERCGSRKLSPLFERYIFLTENLSPYNEKTVCENLAPLVIQKYTDKWNKLYSAIISSDYDPLENYNMEETETPDITRTRDSKTRTKLTTSSSGDTSSGVHGFNSGVPVPTDESEASSEVTVEGSDVDNGTYEESTESGTKELTRHGNIGVTTSQQMLESEIKLREKNNFYDIVLLDVSKMLCLEIY